MQYCISAPFLASLIGFMSSTSWNYFQLIFKYFQVNLRKKLHHHLLGEYMTEEKTNKKRKAVSRQEQIQQLKAKVTKLEAMERNQAKKIDTRRKILAGSYLINQYIDNPEGLSKLLDSFLVRDNDRELFGLKPLKNQINKDKN